LPFLFTATFSMKKPIEAADCSGICSPFEMPPCRSSDCRCIPIALIGGFCIYPISSIMKMVEQHPNLCQSHVDCTKKGSGRFCALSPANYQQLSHALNALSPANYQLLSHPLVTHMHLIRPYLLTIC